MEQLALLEIPIVTSEGWYDVYKISKQEAVELFKSNSTNFISSIKQEYIALIFNYVLGTNLINVNKEEFKQNFGQKALYFKSNGRPLSGHILSVDEIDKLDFFVIECCAPNAI